MKKLFKGKNLNKFLLESKKGTENLIHKIDFDRIFQGLVEAIEGSQLGGMLAIVAIQSFHIPK